MYKNIKIFLITVLLPIFASITLTVTAMKKQKKSTKTKTSKPEIIDLIYHLNDYGKLCNKKNKLVFEDEINHLRWFTKKNRYFCICYKRPCKFHQKKERKIQSSAPKLLPSITTVEMIENKSPKVEIAFRFINGILHRKNNNPVLENDGDIKNVQRFALPGWNPQYSKAKQFSFIEEYIKLFSDFQNQTTKLQYKAPNLKIDKIGELREAIQKINKEFAKNEKIIRLAAVAEFMETYHS